MTNTSIYKHYDGELYIQVNMGRNQIRIPLADVDEFTCDVMRVAEEARRGQ